MPTYAKLVGTLGSVEWAKLPYIAILRSCFLKSRIFITSNCYRSEHMGPVVASYSYRSDVIGKRYRIYPLLLRWKIAFKSKYCKIFFFILKKYTRN
jgi:hypothetical protein